MRAMSALVDRSRHNGGVAQSLMDDLADPEETPTPRRPRRPISALTVVGALLLVAGLGCLGWVAWQYFGTNVTSEKAFHEETSQLRDKWALPADAVGQRIGRRRRARASSHRP